MHFRCLNVLICFDVDLQTSHSNSVTVHTTQLLRQLQPSDIESCPGLSIYYHKDAKTCQKHQMEKDFCRFAVCASCAVHFLEVISGKVPTSHVALEVALETKPNLLLLTEEVASKSSSSCCCKTLQNTVKSKPTEKNGHKLRRKLKKPQ